ncbi:MAG TPA: stage III sporulation protein AE [Clostridia bacterium]|nr:stage III sporulation protein AE [Clostridia bacterium]
MKRCVRLLLLLAVFVLAVFIPGFALAQMPGEVENELDLKMGQYDFSSWQQFFNDLSPEVKRIWGEDTVENLVGQYAEGEPDTDYDGKLETVFRAIIKELKESLGSISAVIGVALLSGVVGVLLENEHDKGIQEIASFLCYAMSVFIVAYLFMRLVGLANGAVSRLSEFSEASTPVLTTLLSAVGSIGASGMLRPLMMFLNTTVIKIFQTVILPVILAGGVFAIVGNLSDRPQLTRLFVFTKSLSKWAIGVVFTVYIAILAVQGMSVAAVDSISLKAVKYTLDKSLPIVGGAVSGTFDTVRGCTVLIKNAAGAAAACIAVGYALSPAVQIGGAALALKLAAALTEPISDGKIPKMLQSVAESCEYVFAAVVAVALMFIITVGLVIAAGGAL